MTKNENVKTSIVNIHVDPGTWNYFAATRQVNFYRFEFIQRLELWFW